MKIPTIEAILTDEETGISVISWVSNPATQVDMLCFNKENEKELSFADEEQHMVTSVVMLADTKIYRETESGQPFYIFYSKDTLKRMCEKMLKDGVFNTCSFEHNGKIIEAGQINLVELYTKDNDKKSPFNIPDGSIIATYKVHNDKIWEAFKSGEISGISLEGTFGLTDSKFETVYGNILKETKTYKNKFMDILKTLKDLIVDIEAQEQLNGVETEVKVEAEEVKETETETETETEPEEPKESEEIIAIKESISALETKIDEIMARVETIEKALEETTVTPVEESEEIEEENKYSRLGKLFNK